jgi:hypothetical protein
LHCPRCGAGIAGQEFYGICDECRRQLRAEHAGGARHVEAADYEPKSNVTPNAVASKE